MDAEKIRIIDNGSGLLVSVRDVVKHLESIGIISSKKASLMEWKFKKEIFSELSKQYKNNLVTMQINIFDFQDMFICWTYLYRLRKYLLYSEREKPVIDFFIELDSPYEIRRSDKYRSITNCYYENISKH